MAPVVSAPRAPVAKPVNEQSRNEFNALKHNLSDIASWEISPNSWDKIQIIYATGASEKQARAFLSSVELPTPEM